MPPTKPPMRAPRYSHRKAALEIRDQIEKRGRGAQKDAAIGIGRTEQAFSAKQRGGHSNWSVEEIGRLADYRDAPPGWPWLPWPEAELRDRIARADA